MYSGDVFYKHVSDRAVIIYLPGYKGNKNEMSFLRNFIIKNKKISFFSLAYALSDANKKNYSIKHVILKTEEAIAKFLKGHHFKECYLIGYSFGAALALALVSRKLIKFNKLVLISIFDDRRDLLKNRGIDINNRENISPLNLIKANKKTMTTFIHGELDASVNIIRGQRVYNNSQKKNSKFITLSVGHYFNDANSKKLLLESLNDVL